LELRAILTSWGLVRIVCSFLILGLVGRQRVVLPLRPMIWTLTQAIMGSIQAGPQAGRTLTPMFHPCQASEHGNVSSDSWVLIFRWVSAVMFADIYSLLLIKLPGNWATSNSTAILVPRRMARHSRGQCNVNVPVLVYQAEPNRSHWFHANPNAIKVRFRPERQTQVWCSQ
jgi:hypothetical protein